MAISLEGQVTEVQSASRFKDNVKRATITLKDVTGFNREITVADKEDNLYLDRYLMITIESYTEFHERQKLPKEQADKDLSDAVFEEVNKLFDSDKGGDADDCDKSNE